jgi:hypothetical protein
LHIELLNQHRQIALKPLPILRTDGLHHIHRLLGRNLFAIDRGYYAFWILLRNGFRPSGL